MIEKLAICGREPSFPEPLHVNRPNLGDREAFLEHVNEALDSRWFTNDGPLASQLEEQIARYIGTDHCVLTCNGTSAMALAVKAMDLGGEVILPSFSFISTAHTLAWQEIDPVFCDVDQVTWNLAPSKCEELITDRTTAIVATHLWGRPCDIEGLRDICEQHRLRLIFDAAHAFGCSHQGRKLGGFGDAEVFSFHSTKIFHTFEGGAVTTNDSALAEKLRQMRNFGFSGYDQVDGLGTNAKMPEVCAAMGLSNLNSIDHFIECNQRNHQCYRKGLQGLKGIQLLGFDSSEENNYQYVVLDIDENLLGISRDGLVRILHAENVMARRYFFPGNHRMEPYRTRYPEAEQRLPETNRISDRVLILPNGECIGESQISQICDIIRFAAEHAESLDFTQE